MPRECGPLIERDGLWWGHAGPLVEDLALFDNLMIVRAIADAGGTVTVIPDEGEGSLAAFQAFEACLDRSSSTDH